MTALRDAQKEVLSNMLAQLTGATPAFSHALMVLT